MGHRRGVHSRRPIAILSCSMTEWDDILAVLRGAPRSIIPGSLITPQDHRSERPETAHRRHCTIGGRCSGLPGPSRTWQSPGENERPVLYRPRNRQSQGAAIADPIPSIIRRRPAGIPWHEIIPPVMTERHGSSPGTGLAYGWRASHSLSFDHHLRFRAPLTAIASAFRCPTSTTRRLPRVTPV